MNYRMILYLLGWIMNIQSVCLLLPVAVGIFYGEAQWKPLLHQVRDDGALACSRGRADDKYLAHSLLVTIHSKPAP